MQLIDVLREAQGGAAIGNVARQFSITPAQAEAAIAALIPQVSMALERTTLSRGGVADVVAAMGDPRVHRALEDPAALRSPEMQRAGIDLLEQMIGNKDKSRALAARASAASGLSEALIKQLLPYLLPMLIGAIAKAGGGALNDILGKIGGAGGGVGGGAAAPQPRSNAPLPQLQPRAGQSPLPLPGSDTPLGGPNPYSDLSDAIRRGGSAGGTGGLPGLVRSILGGLLGFQSRGVLSWILRYVVMRWGWSILRSILFRR